MPILSPRSKSNPKFGTDVSKSKFKLTINGVPRQRRSASAADDAPKSRDWKSKSAPKMNNFAANESNRDAFKSKFQSRKQSSETKSSGEFSFKTEKKQLRTKTEGRKRLNDKSAEAAIGDSKSTPKRTSALDKSFNREAFKAKFQSGKQSSETKSSGELNFKTEKKQFRSKTEGKKSYNEESGEAALGDRPKRGRKRIGIRLDPYDISNKRLDDSIALNETNEEKKMNAKEDSEKVELSKNAQFRAIMPSPSILTFVQENLLGRRRPIELQRAGYNIDLSAPLDNIPFSTSSERERIEESVFRNKLEFFAAAKISSSFPPVDAPEIAFAGRSNVGKSSLLNSLTRQWGVVRTSDKPGLTQTINFFNLGPKLSLVDLPGYGFAYAKEEVKDSWEELVKEYVSTREGLKRVCLLIDTKWGMKPRDHELVNLMERSQTKYQIVLTKTDIVFPIDVARRAMQIEESLKENKSVVQPLMMVSSKSGAGIRSLRTVLAKVARFVKP